MERLSILEPPNPLTPFQRLVEPYNFSFTFTSAFSSTSTPTTVSTPKITITTPAPNQGHGNSLSDTMACGRTRKKAIIKIRGSSLSAEEKDKQILQVVEKATIASRPKPVPIKAAQRIEHTRVLTGWPKVHAEMNLQDLIVARGLLMVTLAGKAQVAGMAYIISRFEAADTVCKTLWGTATILRDLISEPTNANIFGPSQGLHVIPDLIYRYAIREMERVVEVLTCRMLYKTRNTSSMKTFGEMEGIAYTLHTKQGKGLVMFGDLLLKGIREANMQYVRGILETLGIYSKMMGSEREDPKELRRFLTKKKNYMHHQGIEGRKTEVTGMVGQDANVSTLNSTMSRDSSG